MILILKTGSTFESIKSKYGDFEDWIIRKMNIEAGEYYIHATEDFESTPPNFDYEGIVITGSHNMVTDISINNTAMGKWLLEAHRRRISILGICYGHQLLGAIIGGTVGYNSEGSMLGSKHTYLTAAGEKDQLLGKLPPSLEVYKAHKQSVAKLPEYVQVLASGASGLIDAFRLNDNTWGLQFHPEFDQNITRLYIDELSQDLTNEGQDCQKLYENVTHIDYGSLILNRFKQIANNTIQEVL